jgi:hypothetical protein
VRNYGRAVSHLRRGFLTWGLAVTGVGVGGPVAGALGYDLGQFAPRLMPIFALIGPLMVGYWVVGRLALWRLRRTGRDGRATVLAVRSEPGDIPRVVKGVPRTRCDLAVRAERGEPYEGWLLVVAPDREGPPLLVGASFDVRIDRRNPMRMIGPWPGESGHLWTLRPATDSPAT